MVAPDRYRARRVADAEGALPVHPPPQLFDRRWRDCRIAADLRCLAPDPRFSLLSGLLLVWRVRCEDGALVPRRG